MRRSRPAWGDDAESKSDSPALISNEGGRGEASPEGWEDLGLKQCAEGDYRMGVVALARAVQGGIDSYEVYRQMGRSYHLLFEETGTPSHLADAFAAWEKAKGAFEQPHHTTHATSNLEPGDWLDIARLYHSFGAYEGALGIASHLVEEHFAFPRLNEAIFEAAGVLKYLGQFAESVRYLEHLLDAPPPTTTYASLMFQLGRTHELAGDTEASDDAYKEAFSKQPKEVEGLGDDSDDDADELHGDIYDVNEDANAEGRQGGGAGGAGGAGAESKGEPLAAGDAALLQLRTGGAGGGGGGGGSKPAHRRWLGEPETWYKWARLFFKQRNYLMAVDAVKEAIARGMSGKTTAWLLLGRCLRRLNEGERAVEAVEGALSIRPYDMKIWGTLSDWSAKWRAHFKATVDTICMVQAVVRGRFGRKVAYLQRAWCFVKMLAAIRIQSVLRGHLGTVRVHLRRLARKGALAVQRRYRGIRARARVGKIRFRHDSAITIQRQWRQHCKEVRVSIRAQTVFRRHHAIMVVDEKRRMLRAAELMQVRELPFDAMYCSSLFITVHHCSYCSYCSVCRLVKDPSANDVHF